jgi:hypothetical protein
MSRGVQLHIQLGWATSRRWLELVVDYWRRSLRICIEETEENRKTQVSITGGHAQILSKHRSANPLCGSWDRSVAIVAMLWGWTIQESGGRFPKMQDRIFSHIVGPTQPPIQ